MGSNPSYTSKGCDRCTVETVTWSEVQGFIQKLNARGDGYLYRLPTEAEWEYAARAGTSTNYYWGQEVSQACRYANVLDQTQEKDPYSRFDERLNCRDGYEKTSPVGSFQPNAFGLYDMLGNVWEA